jgi:Protein of unknown function (DUF2971)
MVRSRTADAKGLYGILKDRVLWATDFRFLNDKSEFIFGQHMIAEAIASRKDQLSLILSGMWPTAQEALQSVPLFVASLCEDGDLLSQWRGYARLNDGYALAFRRAGLMRKSPCRLAKAIYSTDKQQEILRRVLDTSQRIYVDADSTDQPIIAGQTVMSLLLAVCKFKDDSFRGENEWRLVSMGDTAEPKFRVAAGHITRTSKLN